MAIIENKLLLQTPKCQNTSDSHIQSLNLDLDDFDLNNLDLNNPDMLRPALDRINKMHAHHFNPVRFRFIESMAEKALQNRRSVAKIIEKKALRALSDYVKQYAPFQKPTELLFNQMNNNQGRLAKLTQEMSQNNGAGGVVLKPTLDDELRLQEQELMRSVAATMADKKADKKADNSNDISINVQSKIDYNELSVMRHFRQSQVKRNSERMLTRIIQEGPEDAGPLNSQALIIRSLTTMHDLSPSYINRFISYMDTLLWLEKAGEKGSMKKTKKDRRKS